MLAVHDFYEEDPNRIWFKEHVGFLDSRVKQLGSILGVRACLEVRGADDLSDRDADTFLCLWVEDLFVPHRLKRDNYLDSPIRQKDLEKAICSRLHEIIRSRASMTARSQRMLCAAQQQVAKVGHGARLTRLHFEPQDLFYPEQPLSKRYFILAYEMLDSQLEPSSTSHFARILEHVRSAFRHAPEVQARRHGLRVERCARPGLTQVSDVAALLLEHGDLAPADWINGRRLPHQLELNGATLKNVAVYRECLQFQPSFQFEGGHWVADRLILDQKLPETVRVALIGRPVSDVVRGGLFDLLDHRILDTIEREDRTEFVVESRYVWLPEARSEAIVADAEGAVLTIADQR